MVMAEIQGGGPLAHQQLPMHHHRVQMVMNHHMDLDCHQTGLEIHPANISEFDSKILPLFHAACNAKYIELHEARCPRCKVALFTKQTDVTVLIMLKEREILLCAHTSSAA